MDLLSLTALTHFDATQFLALIGLGALVGFTVGLTGVGGGSLMTPALIGLFGITPTTAIGTDLAFAASTKSFGLVALSRSSAIQWKLAGQMVLGSVAGACLSFAWLHNTKHSGLAIEKTHHEVLRYALAFALLITAISLIFKEKIQRWSGCQA